MKGVATRYVVLFVLGMVSLMVALSLFFNFGRFFSRLECKFYAMRNVVFKSDDPVVMQKCLSKSHEMEEGFISGSDCEEISQGLAPYMIACWKRSYEGKAGEDIWCYELSVSNSGGDCSDMDLAVHLTDILGRVGEDELNSKSAVKLTIKSGETLAYVIYNSTSRQVEII